MNALVPKPRFVAPARGRSLERVFVGAVTLSGYASVAAVVLISIFLFQRAAGLFVGAPDETTTPGAFLGGTVWNPHAATPAFGMLPLLLGSLLVSIGALALAVPIGIGAAAFLSEFCPRRVREILKPTIELLAALPSVVIGFVGIQFVAPWVKGLLGLPTGLTAATGSIALAAMAVPTIVTLAEDAIAAVPQSYRDASLALGANRWQTTWRVVLPTAMPGLIAAVILGAGRVLGETMAVLMVTGGAGVMPHTPFAPVRTLTGTIAAEMGEAVRGSGHEHALFALGAVLFLMMLALNGCASLVLRRSRIKVGGR